MGLWIGVFIDKGRMDKDVCGRGVWIGGAWMGVWIRG